VTVLLYENQGSNEASAQLTGTPDAAGNYDTVSAADVGDDHGAAVSAGALGGCHPSSNPTVHDPGANYLGFDGHVKYLRPNQVSPGGNAPNATTFGACATPTYTGAPNGYQAADQAAGSNAVGQGSTSNPVTLTFSAI
jgi:hypothetical protein